MPCVASKELGISTKCALCSALLWVTTSTAEIVTVPVPVTVPFYSCLISHIRAASLNRFYSLSSYGFSSIVRDKLWPDSLYASRYFDFVLLSSNSPLIAFLRLLLLSGAIPKLGDLCSCQRWIVVRHSILRSQFFNSCYSSARGLHRKIK